MRFTTSAELIKLVRSGKRIGAAFDRKLKEHGITLTQYEVVLALSESGTTRQIDLAEQLFVNRATLIPMLERLEEQGWVRVKPNPDDGRSYWVSLTESGKKQLAQILGTVTGIASELVRGLGGQELRVLSSSLDRILANIEERNP